jgi:hypothetical protein
MAVQGAFSDVGFVATLLWTLVWSRNYLQFVAVEFFDVLGHLTLHDRSCAMLAFHFVIRKVIVTSGSRFPGECQIPGNGEFPSPFFEISGTLENPRPRFLKFRGPRGIPVPVF